MQSWISFDAVTLSEKFLLWVFSAMASFPLLKGDEQIKGSALREPLSTSDLCCVAADHRGRVGHQVALGAARLDGRVDSHRLVDGRLLHPPGVRVLEDHQGSWGDSRTSASEGSEKREWGESDAFIFRKFCHEGFIKLEQHWKKTSLATLECTDET